jgi:hypothetical protein
MAASVFTLKEGGNLFTYNVRGVFDTADETNTVIIDLSAKTGPLGAAPSKIRVDEVWWTINGFNSVTLSFDRTADVILDYFSGGGYMDFRSYGGKIDNGSGGTGDLLLTTAGGEDGGSYSFIISGRFKQ